MYGHTIAIVYSKKNQDFAEPVTEFYAHKKQCQTMTIAEKFVR